MSEIRADDRDPGAAEAAARSSSRFRRTLAAVLTVQLVTLLLLWLLQSRYDR